MTTPRTGRPRGRPKGRRGVRNDSRRYALAFSDAYITLGMAAEKSYLLATALFFSEQAEFDAELSNKLRAAIERVGGGAIVSYEPLGGEREYERRFQETNTLRKIANRYTAEADMNYRTVISFIFRLALFEKDDVQWRVIYIELLSRMIGEQQAAAELIKAMRRL